MSTIYRIKSTNVVEHDTQIDYVISLGDVITYKITSNIQSEVGLYKTEDDYGDTYVFRGDVSNNNVLFGGYYWKIVRTNGDNSIRLIYNGQSVNATGDNTSINSKTYTYSIAYPENGFTRYSNPTYVGYMYGKEFAFHTSDVSYYDNIVANRKYYFADGYEFDETLQMFKLKKENVDPVLGTFSEMQNSFATTPYTCKASTSSDEYCETIIKVNSLVRDSLALVQYISYSPVSYDSTKTNEHSSNAKIQLEKWYESNFIGKYDDNGILITDYIVDETFCNDRSTTNSGYLLAPNSTNYGAYTRLTSSANKTAKLKCNLDTRDKFSSTTNRGNGLLAHPIALITADEVALAGGKSNTRNENFYLRTNGAYWTMTPSFFNSWNILANVYNVEPDGKIYEWRFVAYAYGLRPVINLRSDVLISSGDGTVENPFTLKLA